MEVPLLWLRAPLMLTDCLPLGHKRPAKGLVHRPSRLLLHPGQDVAIGVEGNPDPAMPQPLIPMDHGR